MNYGEAFRLRLLQVMNEKRLTQIARAIMSGLSRNTVYAILAGRNPPRWETACRIAEALDVSLDSFRKTV